jgi:hypothetical protein
LPADGGMSYYMAWFSCCAVERSTERMKGSCGSLE